VCRPKRANSGAVCMTIVAHSAAPDITGVYGTEDRVYDSFRYHHSIQTEVLSGAPVNSFVAVYYCDDECESVIELLGFVPAPKMIVLT